MKKTVCVIFGGASSEYEVSLMSSASIIQNLDTKKFDILTLGITARTAAGCSIRVLWKTLKTTRG